MIYPKFPWWTTGCEAAAAQMNLSSGLKLFWQAILESAKVLEVRKALLLLSSSASQQVPRIIFTSAIKVSDRP